MSEPSAAVESSNPSSLTRWLLVLATGLLVAWCVPRVKPLHWFGPMFGGLTGAIALGLETWFGERPGRGRTVLVVGCAIFGCAAVFAISIRNTARAPELRSTRAAEALMRSMEQQAAAEDAEIAPVPPPTGWWSDVERYLMRRYRNAPDVALVRLAWEILSAGLTAGLLHGAWSRCRRLTSEAAS